jgi:hypothetical protein
MPACRSGMCERRPATAMADQTMSPSGPGNSRSGRRISPNARRMSPSRRRISRSRGRMSRSGLRMAMAGPGISRNGPRMSLSGPGISRSRGKRSFREPGRSFRRPRRWFDAVAYPATGDFPGRKFGAPSRDGFIGRQARRCTPTSKQRLDLAYTACAPFSGEKRKRSIQASRVIPVRRRHQWP